MRVKFLCKFNGICFSVTTSRNAISVLFYAMLRCYAFWNGFHLKLFWKRFIVKLIHFSILLCNCMRHFFLYLFSLAVVCIRMYKHICYSSYSFMYINSLDEILLWNLFKFTRKSIFFISRYKFSPRKYVWCTLLFINEPITFVLFHISQR